MNKAKIGIVFLVLLLGGIIFWNWNQDRNQPEIKILKSNATNKQVQFEMTYKDMKFSGTVTHGGIRSQVIKGYTFEAITKGSELVFSIKSETGDILASKKVSFNG